MRLLLTAAVAIALVGLPAHAHGPAQWINEGHYKNAAGELCCGERDCGELVGGTITPMADGFHVDADFRVGEGETAVVYHVAEIVPYDQAQPSPDGHYWRCQWGGERKCFFAPPPAT